MTKPNDAAANSSVSEDPELWEQQPDETNAAHAAFETYRDLGSARTVTDAYRVHKGKPNARAPSGHFRRWSKTWQWAERARAFDLWVNRQKIRAFLDTDLVDHLDALRSESVANATKLNDYGQLCLDAGREGTRRYLARLYADPNHVPEAHELKALGQIGHSLVNASAEIKGFALGVHQLIGLLTGETPLIDPANETGGIAEATGQHGTAVFKSQPGQA